MKTSDDNKLLNSTISVLLVGPPGGGKTSFALTFPDLWVADCDQNLAGPIRRLREAGQYVPFKYDAIAYDDNDVAIQKLNEQWVRLVVKTDEAVKDPTIRTLFFDSLTHMDRILYAWCCVKLNQTELEWKDYNLFKNTLYQFVMRIRASGKNVLIACHEKIEYDAKGNVKKYTPVLTTNLSQYFGYMFTDIWRCTLSPVGANKYKGQIKTLPSPTSDLKNSLQLPAELEAHYKSVEPYLLKVK